MSVKCLAWYQTYVKTSRNSRCWSLNICWMNGIKDIRGWDSCPGAAPVWIAEMSNPFCLGTSALCQPLPSGGWLKSLGGWWCHSICSCSLTPQQPVPQPSLGGNGPTSRYLWVTVSLPPDSSDSSFRYVRVGRATDTGSTLLEFSRAGKQLTTFLHLFRWEVASHCPEGMPFKLRAEQCGLTLLAKTKKECSRQKEESLQWL